MKTILKYLGVVITLIGVGVLAIHAFGSTPSNAILGIGLFAIVLGFFTHIILNKRVE
ncbi:MAG: hypothetical protein LBD53_09230 [Tannerella sp.]|jgi:hypothetical protein|nr:hypothetical protein [Tannerella sp.]